MLVRVGRQRIGPQRDALCILDCNLEKILLCNFKSSHPTQAGQNLAKWKITDGNPAERSRNRK